MNNRRPAMVFIGLKIKKYPTRLSARDDVKKERRHGRTECEILPGDWAVRTPRVLRVVPSENRWHLGATLSRTRLGWNIHRMAAEWE